MTDPDKTYWLRKKDTEGMPGSPNGLLLCKNSRGQQYWGYRPSLAMPLMGGAAVDKFLDENHDREAVEVRRTDKVVSGRALYKPVK